MNEQAGRDRASTVGISFKKNALSAVQGGLLRLTPIVTSHIGQCHPGTGSFAYLSDSAVPQGKFPQMSSAASSVWVQKGRREHKARWFNPLFIGGRVQAGANSSGMVAEPWEKGSLLRLWTRVSEGQGSPLRILKSPSPSTLGEASSRGSSEMRMCKGKRSVRVCTHTYIEKG